MTESVDTIGALVLQKWINKWYLGSVVQVNETKGTMRIHLRGRDEEHDKWFPLNHPSIRLQKVLCSKIDMDKLAGTCALPGNHVRVYITDVSSSCSDSIVGIVEKSSPGHDVALVKVFKKADEFEYQEVHQSLLKRISIESFNELIK